MLNSQKNWTQANCMTTIEANIHIPSAKQTVTVAATHI